MFDPYNVFSQHAAREGVDKNYCGYFLHSRRLANKGTGRIYNECKHRFQERATNGTIDWNQCKEILFQFKKEQDLDARNMMYHFKFTACNKCNYWDEVYQQYCAHVRSQGDIEEENEPSDEDCIRAAMEVDGTSQ